MASLKFRHYATESALKGNGTVQDALNAFDVGTIVFIDDTQKQYIITSKSNNVVTYKIYYGEAAVVGVSGSGATRTLTFSDGSEIAVTINNVEHATSADTANTAKSVAWNNVTGKPTNFVTTDGTQTITGAKTFTNNVSLQGSTSADSITTEDLIVNGAARFVSGLTGDLKGNVVGNVTGNVTGNVSGSSGSCTGNALTATTLQTARSINGTSFNGSQAITTAKWGTARNITIADNTNEHTQVNNSIDGSANFTLKLPATIKADIIGNASTANSAKSVAWANVTNKPNLVTTDTEQTITGAKIFNNNTTFKNETDIESLTADSLLVTGSARFTNTINGNLKGNVEGNLTGNASTATTAATATEFSTNKAITLTGDVTGSASSKGGWSIATTIANGAVTNAKLANSKITIAGTAVSLGGSIAASTIGAALTTSAPAAYATNAGTATKAAEAEKAIKDSDGNVINTTYIKTVTLAPGTNNGTLKLTVGGTTTDNIAVKGLGSAAYTDSESYAKASHIHNYLPLSGGQMNNTAFIAWNSGADGNDLANWAITDNGLRIISSTSTTSKAPTQYATGLHVKGRYGFQIASQGGNTSNEFFIKNIYNTIWNTLLHSNNYTSYTVKKDGTGASGTWGINISGNASTATKATNADRATGDSDGNAINTTYLKRSGGTVTGNVIFNSSVTADSITAEDLIVNGASRFVSGITGDLVGNVTGNVTGNLSGNASSATKATNDGNGNTITSTYATKTERSNNDITAASLTASKLTLTRAAGNITANIPTWNQDTTGTAAKATADAKGNNIVNTYATKAEVAALPKSMVIKGTLDATHALPTSGMTEGDTYIVGASGKYNNIACKVGDFFVRTSNSWLRIPAGDEWEYNENTIKGIKVNNAGHADTADTAVSAGSATSDSNGNNIASTYARINKVYDDSGDYRQFLGKNGDSSNWIRTTTTGIIPYTSGGASNGHSRLGTSNWYFSEAYIQNIYGYLNGNISGSSTSCSGNAATATKATQDGNGNIIASSYARKISLTAPESDYTDFVILLCSLDNTSVSADLYCFGTLYLKRANILSSQIQKVDICVGKNYNSTNPIFASLSASDANPRPKLVTCTYEGKPYVALYFYIGGSSYTTPYFIGQCSDYTSLKCIKTYCNTTKDIINEEIYNSITPIVTTEIPYVFYGLPKVSKDHGATVEDIALVSSDITGNAATATTASSCSGNSATATKAGYLDTGTMTLHAHNGNEINFGGTSGSDTIYFGYRATESKPIPTSFIFGGSTGTATLTAGGFKKSNSSSSYVLTGDGGHAAISGLSVNYANTSGACTGNAATATKLQTARTIWGQSFDGSGNISGSLTGVTNIAANGAVFSNNYNVSGNTAVAAFIFNKGGDYFGIGPSSGSTSNVGFGTTTNITGTWKSEMMTITTSGNVGIGTTSPTSKLHVAGTGYFAGDVSSASNIIAGGYIKG